MADPLVAEVVRLIRKYDFDEQRLRAIMRNHEGDALRRELLKYLDLLSFVFDQRIDARFDREYTEEYDIDMGQFEKELKEAEG